MNHELKRKSSSTTEQEFVKLKDQGRKQLSKQLTINTYNYGIRGNYSIRLPRTVV